MIAWNTRSLTILWPGAGAEEGGGSGLDCEGVDYTERIWSYNTRQTFFTSSGGIQNYGYSVVAGVVDIGVTCPNYPPTRLGVAVHELAHQVREKEGVFTL